MRNASGLRLAKTKERKPATGRLDKKPMADRTFEVFDWRKGYNFTGVFEVHVSSGSVVASTQSARSSAFDLLIVSDREAIL